jgi:hypothetical protein
MKRWVLVNAMERKFLGSRDFGYNIIPHIYILVTSILIQLYAYHLTIDLEPPLILSPLDCQLLIAYFRRAFPS